MTATYTVQVPDVPDWVCDLVRAVARSTGTDEGTATRLALVEGLLAMGARRAAGGPPPGRSGHAGRG